MLRGGQRDRVCGGAIEAPGSVARGALPPKASGAPGSASALAANGSRAAAGRAAPDGKSSNAPGLAKCAALHDSAVVAPFAAPCVTLTSSPSAALLAPPIIGDVGRAREKRDRCAARCTAGCVAGCEVS